MTTTATYNVSSSSRDTTGGGGGVNFNISEPIGCAQRHNAMFLLFITLPICTIVINSLVLFAVLRSYRMLVRRNHVYIYVSSNLASNLVFALLALIQVCVGIFFFFNYFFV